jgi:hypothetical protein
MHLLGGCVVGPALYAYRIKVYRVARPELRWIRFLAIFAFVESLGVCNELLEFVAAKAHVFNAGLNDTSWDLVENTVGLTVAFIFLEVVQYRFTVWHKPKLKRM